MKLRNLCPSAIRFSQDTISSTFRGGEHVTTVANDLLCGLLCVEDFSTMEVFRDERDRNYYTRNNRMLHVFREAECQGCIVSIPVFEDRKRPSDNKKFTTKNNGTTVRVRNGAIKLYHFDYNKRDLSNDSYQYPVFAAWMGPPLQVDCSLEHISRRRRDIFQDYVLDIHDRSKAIYTDGSRLSYGTGIAMYVPDDGIIINQRCSDPFKSSSDLELLAKKLALKYIVEHGDACNYTILSDCLSCVKVIGNSRPQSRQHKILRDIFSLLDRASNLGVSIKFVWIPGHAGIAGNVIADKYAKEAASDESFGPDPIWTIEYEN